MLLLNLLVSTTLQFPSQKRKIENFEKKKKKPTFRALLFPLKPCKMGHSKMECYQNLLN
jgi:hypothetical protein